MKLLNFSLALCHVKDLIQLGLFVLVVLIFTGCGAPSVLPIKNTVNNTNNNFHLYISNQSFAISPIDIKVFIDSNLVVSENFKVGSQHNWKAFNLKLLPGQHKIIVESLKGSANLEHVFEMTNESWAALGYWFYPNSTGDIEPCPRHFSFDMKNEPIIFQ